MLAMMMPKTAKRAKMPRATTATMPFLGAGFSIKIARKR